ncbi:AimR family lysis-lysogeny pheromone receptor [Bacillus mycoides]|uniref:AimR family lysis-lysogeny pheromone receptor n=1 Tax=Bacillus mycoides TaxID=1405 RepID=UPI002111CEE4|nr:AimR family lysis-lysogeny pheromone receptor [Bacillus mycoides]MCQ6527891.1 AimR family lysis-lysogeny pheromone receptor [Bacillus mycoides]
MKELMKKIKKQMDARDIKIRPLHKKTGIDRTVITGGIVTSKTAEMKLDTFIRLMNEIYEDLEERQQVIRNFILLCEGDLNIRKALCVCQGTGQYELMELIINRHKGNRLLNKYLRVYELFNKRNQSVKKGQPLIDEMDEQLFPTDAECQVIINTLYALSMHDVFNIRAMNPYLDKVEKNLLDIKDQFISDWLGMYFNERMAYVNLFDDNLEVCREKCYKILKNDMDIPLIKATALCCIGESYMFSDTELSEKYLLKSIKYLEEKKVSRESRKYKSFKTTLAFLYIDTGFSLEKIDFKYVDVAEKGYYVGMYKDKEEGLEILYKLVEERGSSPFTDYYIARINNDIIGLERALIRFERVANYHYANAVKRAMKLMKIEEVELI